jgi:hypothetical protein
MSSTNKIVSEEEVKKMFMEIVSMELPGVTREEVWTVL